MNSFGDGGWRAFGDCGRDSRGRRDDRRMDDRSRPHWDRWRDGASGSQWPDSRGPERKGKDIPMKRSRSRGRTELCKLFQVGSCRNPGPHERDPKRKSCKYLHECANCRSKDCVGQANCRRAFVR